MNNNSCRELTDAQLLSVFIGDALAQSLIADHRSLRRVLEADKKTLAKNTGTDQSAYDTLQAVLETARRFLKEPLTRQDAITCVEDTKKFLVSDLRHEKHEVFAALFLDNRLRVLAFERLFYGTIDGATIHPRVVVRKAMEHNAAAIIFAHNHPSGVSEPSKADRVITTRLQEAMRLIDVRVLDHFIIGDEVISFAERGMM